MAEPDSAEFTFSWLALKLLGRGLYSNPWSALSELVANGLDAGARNVHIFIDARNKADATVEVLDDGSGMSREDLNTYVRVGYNKRLDPIAQSRGVGDGPMGRKGIGKLAALFLSPHFYLTTRREGTTTSWVLDARDGRVSDDQHPRLVAVSQVPTTVNDALWSEQNSGTRLILTEVNLTGYGTESISALGSRLANQFLLTDAQSPRVLLWVRSNDTQVSADYKEVEKSIAYKNFLYVVANFPRENLMPAELQLQRNEVAIPARGLPGDTHRQRTEVSDVDFTNAASGVEAQLEQVADIQTRLYRNVSYELSGWIALHATIDAKVAKINDPRFKKNRFYNPAQLRVYVRGKLASDRLLSQLGLTGTYVNYIEGELTFNLLDDDTLPDIATANRQDFDETDDRITILKLLVRPVVRSLIQRRNSLASSIAHSAGEERRRRETAGKKAFNEEVSQELNRLEGLSETERSDLQAVLSNKIQGNVQAKQDYRVFISHASADEKFATFIDEVLRARGAKKKEIFYTSRPGSVEPMLDPRALSRIIKESIVDANTLIFYMTSRNFLRSQFCLFEGGAGWATRGVSEYLKLNMDWDSIPAFLTNGKAEMMIIDPKAKSIELTLELHNYLAKGVFNPMIAHLNRGRKIAGKKKLKKFPIRDVPSAVELTKLGKSPLDYRDSTIVTHWDAGVAPHVAAYMAAYETGDGSGAAGGVDAAQD